MLFSLVSSEILLKGKNKSFFRNALLRNLRSSLGDIQVISKGGHILVYTDNRDAAGILANTFGIDYASPSTSVKPDIEAIKKAVEPYGFPGKSIKVQTRRSEKKFPLSSQQVNEIIGSMFVEKGSTVDLDDPDHTVYVDILDDRAIVSFEKIRCAGGLPVGSSGRVLSMLSGGIDSPVSSWLMMKRGCSVGFLHVHSLPSNRDVSKTKIMKIVRQLKRYHPPPIRLFVAPYSEFYKKSLSLGSRNELVVFRRFLLKLGNRLAEKEHFGALVTGDSLGQVASQTLANIATTNEVSGLPVLRPLISYTKQDIVDLSRKIGLYGDSVEAYKDCCSLVAHKSPSTKVKPEAARKLEEKIRVDEIVDRTLELCDVVMV